MKFSYKWLRELSGTQKSPEALAQEMTVRAFEVEEIAHLGTGMENVVVGHVVSTEKHPDADRLNVAQVDVGTGKDLQIVCGAPNLKAGQKVPVALVGAKLPTEDGKGFKIKKSTIRGVQSNGMICAEDELGLGENHEGIMVLAEDAVVGVPFAQYMKLDDTVIEIDILPNRAHDCLSHEGVAREIAAIEGRTLAVTERKEMSDNDSDGLDVSIQTNKCSRYTATVIDGVDNTVVTPQWMVARLTACGLRSINPIVDITNYVMLEIGQPLHAFSANGGPTSGWDAGVTIAVRSAQHGEKMTLLDDTEIVLDENDIVITDGIVPIALAGVMGGKESGVTESTKSIVLEVAAFDATTIRATRTRHGIVSDAAFHFERDLDPHLVAHAQARAVELITELCGGTVAAYDDVYPAPVEPWTVALAPSYVTRLLGEEIAPQVMCDILARLGIKARQDGEDALECTIPTWRRDITTQEDLIEEIGRLYGYDNIVPKPLTSSVAPPHKNDQRAFEHMTRDVFVASGFDEIKGYAFYSAQDAMILGLDSASHVALQNPQSAQLALMRCTLTPALLRAVAKNRTHTDEVHIFEVGRTFTKRSGTLPQEQHVIGAAIAEKEIDGTQFFKLKGMVEAYAQSLGIEGIQYDDTVQENDVVPQLHPSRRSMIRLANGSAVGFIGEVSKKACAYFGIKNARVAVVELNLDMLMTAMQSEHFFAPLPKYPTVERDLSMTVGPRTRVADVERVLYDAGGVLLQDVDLFDLYVNEETGERSMAFHLIFSASDRTLKSEEVDKAVAAMITAVEEDENITVKK